MHRLINEFIGSVKPEIGNRFRVSQQHPAQIIGNDNAIRHLRQTVLNKTAHGTQAICRGLYLFDTLLYDFQRTEPACLRGAVGLPYQSIQQSLLAVSI